MIKKIILIILVLLYQLGFSQKSITETQKLATTCKVWGFLKYYHPKVASGKKNWNQQLFDILPKVDKAKTKDELSILLENWIDSLGVVNKSEPRRLKDSVKFFYKNLDLSWINNKKKNSKKLSKKLRFIEKNRFQGEHYYVGILGGENIFMKNESLSEFNGNEKKLRILALFTYWNLIEYFFPYKYLMDTKWDVTLEKMMPTFIDAKNDDEFYLAMQKLTVKLNDSHTVFYKYKSENINFFPAKCKIIDDKIIVTEILADSLAKADDIKIGDVITKVNNKTVKDIILDNRELISASNEAFYLNKLVKTLMCGPSDNITLEFLKEDKHETRTIKWYDYHDSHTNQYKKAIVKKEKFQILENNIGYVDMGILNVKSVPEMIEKLNTTQSIIFDMRNYPNGTFQEISNFLNAKEKTFAIYTIPDLTYPGRFKWSNGTSCGSENINNYKDKVVVLLNEESISQSEWTAMCFQTADNTTIIGSQTAGADGNVSDVDFIKTFYSKFSGIGVYYPDKRETQRIGIIPDIEVKPTIKGIQEGRDEVLERAVKFIETGK